MVDGVVSGGAGFFAAGFRGEGAAGASPSVLGAAVFTRGFGVSLSSLLPA